MKKKIISNVNKEQLLTKISQEEIMEKYFMIPINFSSKYSNPFRDDRKPGCYFSYSTSGTLYFIDYASEKISYDCFDIAELRTGIPFKELISYIYDDLEVANREIQVAPKIQTERELCDIRVQLCSFDEADLEWWNQYQIKKRHLEFFNIRKCCGVWINNELWTKGELDPVYRYRQKDQIKIYRPLAKKEDKFRNNYFGGLVDGWMQLPVKGDVCFIQKAMKETVSMYTQGFTAIGVRSETTMISKNTYELLKNRFKFIIPYMDNDQAGLKMLEKYEKEYGLRGFCNPEGYPKDFGDWIKEDKVGINKYVESQITSICSQTNIGS